MIVLTRNIGETICIGDEITITVVSVDRGKVRLAVKAPDKVNVTFAELKPNRESKS